MSRSVSHPLILSDFVLVSKEKTCVLSFLKRHYFRGRHLKARKAFRKLLAMNFRSDTSQFMAMELIHLLPTH